MQVGRALVFPVLLLILLLHLGPAAEPASVRFAILGDRTGEAQPGVYEEALREAAAAKPSFVVATGDLIQGANDAAAPAQWIGFKRILQPFRKYPFYPAPGNHDVWSAASAHLFQQNTGRPLHYGFDYGSVHVTILDNSRGDALSPDEIAFLESDLKAHAGQPLKIVVSHRPSWILDVAMRNGNFDLHRLARRYGVRYVIAGHVHQLMRFELDGVDYLSMPSSGGHLRNSEQYRDGWFFGYVMVEAAGASAKFEIHELKPPYGKGRVTRRADWGMLGLVG